MLIIDRFEGDKAVIEFDDIIFDIPKKALPEEAKEGDIITIHIDKNLTENRKEKIQKLSEELFE